MEWSQKNAGVFANVSNTEATCSLFYCEQKEETKPVSGSEEPYEYNAHIILPEGYSNIFSLSSLYPISSTGALVFILVYYY